MRSALRCRQPSTRASSTRRTTRDAGRGRPRRPSPDRAEAVGLGDFGPPSGYVPRQIRRWRGQLDHARVRPVPDLDWTADWLEQHRPPEPERVRLVHGDYRLDNVIFASRRPRLLGVVDWELATLGDPLADLGWLLAFWREPLTMRRTCRSFPSVMDQPGFPNRAALTARYAEIGRAATSGPDLLHGLRDVAHGGAAGRPLGQRTRAWHRRRLRLRVSGEHGPAFAARLRRLAEDAPSPAPPREGEGSNRRSSPSPACGRGGWG